VVAVQVPGAAALRVKSRLGVPWVTTLMLAIAVEPVKLKVTVPVALAPMGTLPKRRRPGQTSQQGWLGQQQQPANGRQEQDQNDETQQIQRGQNASDRILKEIALMYSSNIQGSTATIFFTGDGGAREIDTRTRDQS
jgi:hypothetical protein